MHLVFVLNNYEGDEKKGKKKKAHKSFLAYLKKADDTCKKINKIDDWAERLQLAGELAQDIPNLLENFADVLSKEAQKKLKNYSDFRNIYNKIPGSACAKLIKEIQNTIDELQVTETSTYRGR